MNLLCKSAWHEAGHVVMAFLLDAPVRHAIVGGRPEPLAARFELDVLPLDGQVDFYMAGAIGRYLYEKPKGTLLKAVHCYLRSPQEANDDYMAAVHLLMAATNNMMESRRRIDRGIARTYKTLSALENLSRLERVAKALIEVSPQMLYGYQLQNVLAVTST